MDQILLVDDAPVMAELMVGAIGEPARLWWLRFDPRTGTDFKRQFVAADRYCGTGDPVEAIAFIRSITGNLLVFYDMQLGTGPSPQIKNAVKMLIAEARNTGTRLVFVLVYSGNYPGAVYEASDFDERLLWSSGAAADYKGISTAHLALAADMLQEGLQGLERLRTAWNPPLVDRLWPSSAEGYFHSERGPIPHTFTKGLGEDYRAMRDQYLCGVLGCQPPAEWSTDEAGELSLHEELKHVVGGQAIAHTGRLYGPTLGSIVLVLAAATRPGRDSWLRGIRWPPLKRRIVGSQDSVQSRAMITSMFGLFETIRTVDEQLPEQYSPGQPAVRKVMLTDDTLRIFLGIPMDFCKPGKTLNLREHLQGQRQGGDGGGGFVAHLKTVSENLGRSTDGLQQVCGIRVFCDPDEPAKSTVLEFKAWT